MASLPGLLPAQTLRGRVLEADGSTPAAFVSIVMRDSAARELRRLQTSSNGDFALALPRTGTFQLRVLRIGRVPLDTTIVATQTDEVIPLSLRLSERRVVLAPIEVRARSSCTTASAPSADVLAMWDQAAAALSAVSSTAADAEILVETISYERSESPSSGDRPLLRHDAPVWRRGDSFRSPAVSDLAARGFVRSDSSGVEFIAPDARFLADSLFARDYCLLPFASSAPKGGGEDRRELAFRHAHPNDALVSIEGELSLDSSGVLREVRYSYRGLPRPFRDAPAGGVVRFLELPTRGWIVSQWYLRMPVVVLERKTTGTGVSSRVETIPRLRGWVERGGFVQRVRLASGAVVATPTTYEDEARLEIVDRGGRPLARGSLQITRGVTRDEVQPDDRGIVRIARARAGPDSLHVVSALAMALGAGPQHVPLTFLPTSAGLLATAVVESDRDLLQRLCERSAFPVATGLMPEGVLQAATDTLRITELVGDSAIGRVLATPRRVEATGRWYACGLPRGRSLALVSARQSSLQLLASFRLPPGVDVATVDPLLAPERAVASAPAAPAGRDPASPILRLLVRSAADSTPLAGARIVVDDSLEAIADARGHAVLTANVLATQGGAHAFVVRRLGFQPLERSSVALQPGVEDTVYLSPIAVRLTEVMVHGRAVSAPARYADVLRRAASNGGVLFTERDLTDARDFQTALQQVPGVSFNDRGITFQRCQSGLAGPLGRSQSAKVQVYIDGVRVTALADSNATLEALRLVHPKSVAFLEVYRGVSRIPVEFLNDACAVIAIWTKAY